MQAAWRAHAAWRAAAALRRQAAVRSLLARRLLERARAAATAIQVGGEGRGQLHYFH